MSRVAQVARSAVREVVVVGAGIAGCTAAYELARLGFRISLFDQRGIAPAASGRNMGLLLNDVEDQSVEMMYRALEVYRELEAGPVPFQLREEAYLLVAQDEGQMRSTEQRALEMRRAGLSCELLPEGAVRDGVPELRAGVAGAFLLRGCWAVSAAAATRAFAEAARSAGARLRMGVRVAQLVFRSGRLTGVLTDDGPISADAVVLAAGPWLPTLLSGLPVSSGRGWLLRTGPLGRRLPWVVMEMAWPELDDLGRAARPPTLAEVARGAYDLPAAAAVAMVPQPGGEALLGTSLAPSLLEPVEGVDMPGRIARRALELLPGFAGLGVTGGWYGLRPMTPDGLPLVGATPIEGLYLHAGHGSIGMQSAPWTARLLAGALQGGPVPERFAAARFGDGWAELEPPQR
jgi:glycine/D-amino acid oxidase-like deaminating enzyme